MKKNGLATCHLFFFLIVFIACDKQLDLAPEDTLTETEVFSEVGTAEAALLEAYDLFFQGATFFGIAYAIADITTWNVELPNNSGYLSYVDGTLTPEDFTVNQVWRLHYQAINVANNIIKKVPEIGTYDEIIERQHVAEAKFVRAYAYLNLLRLYGDGALCGEMTSLGLVLQLTPFEGLEEAPKPRANNGAVFDQIIQDLEEANLDLPTVHKTNEQTRARATQGGARALLSRVWLYTEDFEKAASIAATVLEDEMTYELTTDLRQLFPFSPDNDVEEMTKEWIFGFPTSSNNGNFQFGTNNLDIIYYFKNLSWVHPDFIELYDTNDLRRKDLIWEGFESNPNLTTYKFNSSNGHDNVPMIRLAEVILNRAEGLVHTSGLTQEAVDLLNRIRQRAQPDSPSFQLSDFNDATDLLNAILLERRLELAFEGHHRYDLIRTGQLLRNPDIPKNRFAFPIPQYEIELSEGVVQQNPGY